MPLISVVIPVFNRSDSIRRALDSVAAQTFHDYEIIVVDDGSTDETVAAVEDARIGALNVIRHAQNRGAAAARNAGIRAARGRYIAFLDSDDIWMPEKLARQTTALWVAGGGAVACTCGYILHKNGQTSRVEIDLLPGQFRTDILYGCMISPGTTLMVDRHVFDDIGEFDEDFRRLEDWDWLLRFANRYDITCVPEPLAEIYVSTRREARTTHQTELTLDAINRIASKHLPELTLNTRRRRLRSALMIERASIMFYDNSPVRAIAFVFASLFVYPKRNTAFFRMLWRSFLSLWTR